MSPFVLINTVSRKPILRWLMVALVLAGLLLITARAWSAPKSPDMTSSSVVVVDEPATKAGDKTAATQSTAKPADKASVAKSTTKPVNKATVAKSTAKTSTAKSTPVQSTAKTVANKSTAAKPTSPTPAPKTAPVITLSAMPEGLAIAQGAGGASTISITSVPTPKMVKLTATGLPAGAMAAFTPEDADGHSTLLVSASKDAPTGPVKVTVTASDGTSTSSTVVTVNIVGASQPDFAPSVQPGRIDVSQGSDNSCEISLTPSNGFKAPVSLTLSGVPAGVTAVFDPANMSTKSTLHIVATPMAQVAATPITIVATSGSITHTARILLSVESRPDFALGTWADRVSMAPSGMGVDTVRIEPLNGFSSPVALAVTGMPAGVHAHFSPALAKTGSSTLLISTDSAVAMGSSTLTITATCDGIVHEHQVNVDITSGGSAPSFTLSAWPDALTIASGGRAANTVSVLRDNGFNGMVDLSVTGLPDGVTAAFAPPSTHGSSTLTLAARPGLSIGTPVPVTVTGMSGGTSHTVIVTLNVGDRQASAQ